MGFAFCYGVERPMLRRDLLAISLSLVILAACESGPAVERSMLRTEKAKRLPAQLVAGVAQDTIFIPRPYGYAGESQGKVWKFAPDNHYAIQVRVEYGAVAGDLVEVRVGLNEGDQVILSDMSAWSREERVRLQR
jgi:hypothetical protein